MSNLALEAKLADSLYQSEDVLAILQAQRKNYGMERDAMVHFRLNETEYKTLTLAARRSGMTLSSYCRDRCLNRKAMLYRPATALDTDELTR